MQAELETEVGNYIPCKGIAQLTNARLQRTAIALSSDLFRWDAYPTFYGSKYVYVPKDDVLLGLPGKATPGEIKNSKQGSRHTIPLLRDTEISTSQCTA